MSKTPDAMIKTGRAFALLVVAVTASSCAIDHIRELREAESAFSRAAAQENSSRFTALGSAPAGPPSASEGSVLTNVVIGDAGYRLAAESTRKLIATKEAELRQDNLLCTALMIRTFSLWRLGDGATASNESQKDCKSSSAQRDDEQPQSVPRDHALLQIIPALVKIDEAAARINDGNPSNEDYDKELKYTDEALKSLASADKDKSIPRDHPIRNYLFMSRMAAIRVRHSAPTRERLSGPVTSTELAKASTLAGETLLQYRAYLHCDLGLPTQPDAASVIFWRGLFGSITLGSGDIDCAAAH